MEKSLHNLTDRATKARLLTKLGALQGPHYVSWTKLRPGKTRAQRGYYFGVVVEAFQAYMHEAGNTGWTKEMCHEALKIMHLTETATNPKTGEVITTARSVGDLDIAEMAGYIDACIAFLQCDCDTPVPPPEQYAPRGWKE